MAEAKRDENRRTTLLGLLNTDATTPINITASPSLHTLNVSDGIGGTSLTPTSRKGGVVRVIDSATGDIARTTGGWIEDEKYKWYGNRGATAFSAEFDSAVTRTGKFTLKVSNTDTTGTGFSATTGGGGATYTGSDTNYLIPIKASTVYRLNCYAKTNNVALNSVSISIQTWDSNLANRATPTGTNFLSGTQDWTLLTTTFTTGATQAFMRLLLNNNVAGNISDAWFDVNSMTLEEVSTITAPSASLLYPKVTAVTSKDNIDQSLDPAGAYADIYLIQNSISESATGRQTFTPTKKKQYGIKVWVTDRGSNNWTLIVHDSSNNLIASKTLPYTSLTNNAMNSFNFTTPWSWVSGTYHFHIISDSEDPSEEYIKTNTIDDLETASFITLYSKNTTNFTVRTDTQTMSVTAPTTDGWADGYQIDTYALGYTPLSLASGNNNIYYSSNGPTTADGTVDPSLQAIFGGRYFTTSTDSNIAKRDENRITTLLGVSDVDGETPVTIYADSSGNLLVNSDY